jgi:hypothetical protein
VWAETFTRWTVWISVAAYILALGVTLSRSDWRWSRRWWTLGCLACVAHIGLAMHFFHGWSHAAAYADTARQTREAVGLGWGGGVYFNYVFAAAWIADVAWWWVRPDSRAARAQWLSAILHVYLAFIMFNATVVFEERATRWASAAAFAGLAVMIIAGRWGVRPRNRQAL